MDLRQRAFIINFDLPVFSESRSYEVKVLTESSEREEVTIVRLSPKAVQRAVEETFKKNIQVKIEKNTFYIYNYLTS